ncbi:copper amine oxidase [Paenibacillus sp. PK3_47]|uniref:leucine-rich repeat domain-containing protein n=1 Tax=Paenibacillus sp. PK3_47 TaxID=2072642 RepID=UPI00201D92B4|nr:stalk domain-containing protein [Paenibacillus sp. PK3_47]UQZ32787.1 copper amine oxidase [Paenibacillus sp. PK3_47]
MNRFLTGIVLSVVIGFSLTGQAPMAQAEQTATVQASTEVSFQDEQLKKEIKKLLNKSDDEAVLQKDLEALTSINLYGKGIQSLEGLQYATNLSYVSLNNNKIVDLSPLSALTKLKGINLNANGIISIEALASLTKLEELQLSGNQITSIDVVKRLPLLRFFEANDNEITDIQALSKATKLEVLEVSNNRIAVVNSIVKLPNLMYLKLSNTQISDLSVLKPLSDNLLVLHISGNQISDLRDLEGMTKLTALYAENNQIEDITPLKNMKNMSSLNLRSNLIYDLEPLRSLTNITKLYLDNNRIWNIGALKNHKFDTHYDTGALLYGLTLTDNYLDLRSTTKSYQLLQNLAGDGHQLNQFKAQRLVIGSTTAYVGESSYKLDTAPFIHNSRTYVPVRFVAEHLGANVTWDKSKQEVMITKGSTTIRWVVNKKQAIVNGKAVMFDTAPLLKHQRTFIPVRFVSELLATDVEYVPGSRSVLIFEVK